MHGAVGANLVLTLLCLLSIFTHALARIPYTPSSLLYSSQHNGSFAYLLRTTNERTEFISLDVSTKVDTNKPSYTVLRDEAPFKKNNAKSAYTPVIDQDGVVKVYAGDCWDSESQPKLWTFKADPSSSTGDGKWEDFSALGLEGQASSATNRPRHLSAGFTYSSSNQTKSSVFAFAGMCPYQGDSTSSWVSAANYSQTMTVLVPCERENCYQASTTGDRAPPIPEAGFTITPLQATFGYADGELRQQQDFLLIGGHTEQAFINMSEVAVFSAPQNSWSFVTVGSVAETSRNDLAFRDTALIEPRSGHTAVLSPDGSKVIVFGGWVGNTSVAASPQLAILEVGGGFAGSGKWTWRLPSSSGGPEGPGVYGHGATMLPGGIMMVAGGYRISQLSKRSGTEPELNSQIYLYNVTTNTWASSYQNPSFDPAQAANTSAASDSGPIFNRKAGLGVGIGLGVPALAGLGLLAFYVCRRRGVRRGRDNEIRKLALGAQRPHYWGRDSELASSIRNPSMRESVSSDYPWSANNRPRSVGKKVDWNDTAEPVAERTGLLGDPHTSGNIHVPKKHNRPILNAGVYRPPYHDYRRGENAGVIHPIDEREEDEIDQTERDQARETADSQLFATARNTQVYALHASGDGTTTAGGGSGRASPDKEQQALSNLSDSSASEKSAQSVKPVATSGPASRAIFFENQASASGHDREAIRSQDSSTSNSSYDKRYSSDSFSTAHSTMSQRQAEGEFLLRDSDNIEPSPSTALFSHNSASQSRARAADWIGGIRRVLSVSRRRPAASDEPATISRASGIDAEGSGTSPANSTFPRRSVSASAGELFKRKQGAKDWGVGNRLSQDTGYHSARSSRGGFGLDGHVDIGSDEEWDVEGAAEGRRVQVTFTVPKEKLRVVNASAGDMDGLSVNSVSRSNSSS